MHLLSTLISPMIFIKIKHNLQSILLVKVHIDLGSSLQESRQHQPTKCHEGVKKKQDFLHES